MAQVAHGLAQGKVGSGFDVCAAVFGSMRYTRIDGEQLAAAMHSVEAALQHARSSPCSDGAVYAAAGDALTSARWTYTRAPFRLPPSVTLAVVDIHGGSETVGMVKRVLAWRDAHSLTEDDSCGSECVDTAALARRDDGTAVLAHMAAAAAAAKGPSLWRLLAERNGRVDALMSLLTRVAVSDADAWLRALRLCSTTQACTWRSLAIDDAVVARAVRLLADVHDALRDCSRALKRMGTLCDVPIEPDEQSALAAACHNVPGCVAAVVPGAGGYDALALVLCEGGGARTAVQEMLHTTSGGTRVALTLRDGPAVGEPNAGAVVEVDDEWA